MVWFKWFDCVDSSGLLSKKNDSNHLNGSNYGLGRIWRWPNLGKVTTPFRWSFSDHLQAWRYMPLVEKLTLSHYNGSGTKWCFLKVNDHHSDRFSEQLMWYDVMIDWMMAKKIVCWQSVCVSQFGVDKLYVLTSWSSCVLCWHILLRSFTQTTCGTWDSWDI